MAKKENNEVNQLKKMSRSELLSMLISITEKCDELELELEETKRKLEEKEIVVARSGSLAEAALKLNGIFEDADKAAAQYVDSLKAMFENQGESAEALIENAKKECARLEEETKSKCEAMLEAARRGETYNPDLEQTETEVVGHD